MSNKPQRNALCQCGSGNKYKYCCISKELKERKPQIGTCKCHNCNFLYPVNVDFTDDLLNKVAAENIPIMNFCKDNGLYFFGMHINVGELTNITERLRKGILKIEEIIEIYKRHFRKEHVFGWLDCATKEQEIFKKREKILKDALGAHFDGKYTLSVPVFFAQLEGLLRDNGNISNRDSVKSTIPTTGWDERMAFSIKDNAEYFKVFIHKLFEGGKDASAFNRNPVLHGFGLDYHTEENSMVLFMAILEIRNFLWWNSNLPVFKITHSDLNP